jgi:hypothetical protein
MPPTPNLACVGQTVMFSVVVSIQGGGYSSAGELVTFRDRGIFLGNAPLDAHGKATFRSDRLGLGTHSITVSYGGTADLDPSKSVTVLVTVVPNVGSPTVTALERFGFHAEPTVLVLTFSTALEQARAADLRNDHLVGFDAGSPPGPRIRIRKAVYHASTRTVTLFVVPRSIDLLHDKGGPASAPARGPAQAGVR